MYINNICILGQKKKNGSQWDQELYGYQNADFFYLVRVEHPTYSFTGQNSCKLEQYKTK